MLRRAWRRWRRQSQLVAPMFSSDGIYASFTLDFDELRRAEAKGEVPAYDELAKFWHEHSLCRVPEYSHFLRELAAERGVKLNTVLDLACGTGVLYDRLARIAPTVVGLDASEAMLTRARLEYPDGTFVRDDFRIFQLDQRFDAVVCASNSLNYVANLDELRQVFRTVAAHLNPGGLFVFDTVTEDRIRYIAGYYVHCTTESGRFAIQFRFDPKTRREESLVILPSGVEVHRRIPLDPPEIIEVAKVVGLDIVEYFSETPIFGRSGGGGMSFFVLARPG